MENILDRIDEVDAYGRLLANIEAYGGDEDDVAVLNEEINKVASWADDEYEEHILGHIAAAAFQEEMEDIMDEMEEDKVAMKLPFGGAISRLKAAAGGIPKPARKAMAYIAGGAGAYGAGVATPHVLNRRTENQLMERLKQQSPEARMALGRMSPRQRELVGLGLRQSMVRRQRAQAGLF